MTVDGAGAVDLPARADYVRALAWVDDATLAVGAWDSAVHLEAV